MQNLMPPIDTTDHAFHDGDPTTGQLGTIVTAAWLNDVQGATRDIQAEIIAVLTKAGIQPNPQKQNQLAEAISQIIGNGGYATSGDLTLGLSKKIDKADIAQQLGNDTTKVPSLHLVTTELGKKASVADANSKLAKDQNGADIPNKDTFIKNLGLPEKYLSLSGGTITANGKAIELKTTATGNPAYIQIVDSAGKVIHQFGKLSDKDEFSIYNAAENIDLSLNSQGLSVGNNPVALAKDVLKANNNLSDVKNKQTARNNLGLGAAALLGAPIAVAGEYGYIQIPALVNGVETNLILQWMTVGLNQATGKQMYSKYVNWPMPFPNACLSTLSALRGVAYDLDYNPVTSSVIIDRTQVEVGSGYRASSSTAFVWGIGY